MGNLSLSRRGPHDSLSQTSATNKKLYQTHSLIQRHLLSNTLVEQLKPIYINGSMKLECLYVTRLDEITSHVIGFNGASDDITFLMTRRLYIHIVILYCEY